MDSVGRQFLHNLLQGFELIGREEYAQPNLVHSRVLLAAAK
jgi:hypothetical protein